MGAPVLQKKKFFASFGNEFFASKQSEINTPYFALFRFQTFFVSLPIFSLRFKAQQNKRFFTLFHFEVK
jgi:hypothetical protein